MVTAGIRRRPAAISRSTVLTVVIIVATLLLTLLGLLGARADTRTQAAITNALVGCAVLVIHLNAVTKGLTQRVLRSVALVGVGAALVVVGASGSYKGNLVVAGVGLAAVVMAMRQWFNDTDTPAQRALFSALMRVSVAAAFAAQIYVFTWSTGIDVVAHVSIITVIVATAVVMVAGRTGDAKGFALRAVAGMFLILGLAIAVALGLNSGSAHEHIESAWRDRIALVAIGFAVAGMVRVAAARSDSETLRRLSLVAVLLTFDVARFATIGTEADGTTWPLTWAFLAWNTGFGLRMWSDWLPTASRRAEPLRLLATVVLVVAADLTVLWFQPFLPVDGGSAVGKLIWIGDIGAAMMILARWMPDRWGYFTRRVVLGGITILIVTMMVFYLTSLTPDSWWKHLVYAKNSTPASQAREMALLGVDKPIFVQYLTWLNTLLQLPPQLGFSDNLHSNVSDVLVGPAGAPWFETRVGATFVLMMSAYVVQLVIAIPIGILSATKPHSKTDNAVTTASFVGISMPNYWLGSMLIYLFAVIPYQRGWGKIFPVGSEFDDPYNPSFTNLVWHLALPAIVLAVQGIAAYARFVRGSMLDVLNQDFIRTARAKGMSPLRVTIRHGFRNSLLPLITLMGIDLPQLFVGAIITEFVFNWPGMGQLSVQEISAGDTVTVIAILFILSVLVVLGSVIADLCYTVADPRIKFEEA